MSTNSKFEEKINSIILKLNQVLDDAIEFREMINQPRLISEIQNDPIQILDDLEGQSLAPMQFNTLQLLKEHSQLNAHEMSMKSGKPRSSESLRLNQLEELGYAKSYFIGRIKYFQIKRT